MLGGELAVGLTTAGDMLSIGGELEPDGGIDTTPAIGAAAAAATAIAAVAKSTGVASSAPARPRARILSIYDPRILGGPGIDLPRAVWRLEVTDGAARSRSATWSSSTPTSATSPSASARSRMRRTGSSATRNPNQSSFPARRSKPN